MTKTNIHTLLIIFLIAIFSFQFSTDASAIDNKNNSKQVTNPILGLLERIDTGASDKFIIELQADDDNEYFELDQLGDKVVVRGSNYVAIATGINWYLKYYLNIHLSWNGMQASLPQVLPAVNTIERHDANVKYRYEFNFCTFSYGTAFWDWARWEQEIDWMALHGVNMPLMLTGTETVWRDLLLELNYTKEEINQFIAGPAFQAWWQMNNLEGWGGPNPDSWYENQVTLGNQIIDRYREFGIEPVMPGYAGMVPSGANAKLGLSVSDPGTWCTFQRPAFLLPTDSRFEEIADAYYAHMENLFGDDLKYFTADPFHEGGNVNNVDLAAAGTAIFSAMTRTNEDAKWVIQSWHENPRLELINPMNTGDVIVLDLFSDGSPKWQSPGYGKHDWIFTMLHNFGGRSGMYGRLSYIADSYNNARNNATAGPKLQGAGVAPEGYELDPVMYELLFELPWRNEKVNIDNWLADYITARYGQSRPELIEAWDYLEKTVYKGRAGQEGATESVLSARPALDIYSVSTWGSANINYNIYDLRRAAMALLEVAEDFRGVNNFEYDLVNVVSQTLADYGFYLQKEVTAAYRAGNKEQFETLSNRFLELILAQDQLLSTRSEFLVGNWLEQAKSLGSTEAEKTLYEWNARTLITVWGNKSAANAGGLNDYSYRSWAGLMKDFYYERWKAYFELLSKRLNGETVADIDFFDAYEYPWIIERNSYPTSSTGNAIDIARQVFEEYANDLSVCEPSGSFCNDAGQGFVTDATTTGAEINLNFSQTERPTTVFVDATDNIIEVKRGQTFTLNVTGDEKDGHAGVAGYRYFKWTHKYIYVDWNGDNSFDEDELLYAIPLNGDSNDAANFSKEIQVPTDAHIGDVRLRIRYTNGYSVDINSAKDACQAVDQGGVYDFTVRINEEATLCIPGGTLGEDAGHGYITDATTTGAETDLNFTQVERPATVYVDAINNIIKIGKGQTFTLTVNGDEKDGHAGVAGYRYFKWTHKYIYADWNGDNIFDENELLYAIPSNGEDNNAANFSKEIQVPASAKVGDITLRIRYTNAYGVDLNSANNACQDVDRGAIYDFTIRISENEEEIPICTPGGSLCRDNEHGYITEATTIGADTNLNFSLSARPSNAYVDATDHVIKIKRGGTFTLNAIGDMKDGHAGVAGYRYFKWTHKFIYADWNGDNIFDEDELLYAIPMNGDDNNAANISKEIEVPADAKLGDIVLRIRYTNGSYDDINNVKGACQSVDEGGIYDFTLSLSDLGTSSTVTSNKSNDLYCYPNPVKNILNFSDAVVKAVLLDINGKVITKSNEKNLSISHLPNSVYIVQLFGANNQSQHQVVIKK